MMSGTHVYTSFQSLCASADRFAEVIEAATLRSGLRDRAEHSLQKLMKVIVEMREELEPLSKKKAR